MKNYKFLWIVVVLLVGMNIWLLYGKVGLRQQVTRLQYKVLQQEGVVTGMGKTIYFTPSVANRKVLNQPVYLVALFTDYGCTSCLVDEINRLNKWQQKYQNSISAYFLGSTKGYLEGFGAEFKYHRVSSFKELFNVRLPIGNPIVLVVDENRIVHSIHTNDTSRPGSDRRRAYFYKRMKSLFTSVYEE